MGTYKRGINGGFSGKAGSVIGSKWRKIDYLKGMPSRSHKPATEAQLQQRQKFRMMSAFLRPLSKMFEWSYTKVDTRFKTAYNIALGYHLKWGFVEKDGEWVIDFNKAVLSRGSLPKPVEVTMEYKPEGKFSVKWSPLVRDSFVSAYDKVTLLFYSSDTHLHVISSGDYKRGDGEAVIDVQDDAEKNTWHGFMFYTSAEGDNSMSVYLGEVVG